MCYLADKDIIPKEAKNTADGVTSVWMGHLNQDPIENFFGSIRSHVNPTPEKFEAAFTTLLVNSLSSIHAPGANCEADSCYSLYEVLITGGAAKAKTLNIPDITFTPLKKKMILAKSEVYNM